MSHPAIPSAIILLAVLMSAACSPSVDARQGGLGAIVVANGAISEIRALHVRPSGTADWGPDRLDDGYGRFIIGFQESLTITGLAEGAYDVRAAFANGREAQQTGVTVAKGPHAMLRMIPGE